MPYTTKKDREKYEPHLSALREAMNENMSKGDLTYLLYCLGLEYFNSKGASYTTMSTAIGSLNDAGAEIRRRYLNSYEDEKIKENGDIE